MSLYDISKNDIEPFQNFYVNSLTAHSITTGTINVTTEVLNNLTVNGTTLLNGNVTASTNAINANAGIVTNVITPAVPNTGVSISANGLTDRFKVHSTAGAVIDNGLYVDDIYADVSSNITLHNSLLPDVTNTLSLGTSTLQFSNIYAITSNITNLSITDATITNLSSTNSTLTNISGTLATLTNISGTLATLTDIISTTATLTNLIIQNTNNYTITNTNPSGNRSLNIYDPGANSIFRFGIDQITGFNTTTTLDYSYSGKQLFLFDAVSPYTIILPTPIMGLNYVFIVNATLSSSVTIQAQANTLYGSIVSATVTPVTGGVITGKTYINIGTNALSGDSYRFVPNIGGAWLVFGNTGVPTSVTIS